LSLVPILCFFVIDVLDKYVGVFGHTFRFSLA
jgi:hypothetical protein